MVAAVGCALREGEVSQALRAARAFLDGGSEFHAFERVAVDVLAACGSLSDFAECLRRSIVHADCTGDCSMLYSLLGSAQWPKLLLEPVPKGWEMRVDHCQNAPSVLAFAVELGLPDAVRALMVHGVDPVLAEHAIASAIGVGDGADEAADEEADEADEASDEAGEVCARYGFMERPPIASFLSRCMTKGFRPELVRALLARGCRPSNFAAYSVGPLRHYGKIERISLLGLVAIRANLDELEPFLEHPDVEAVVHVMDPHGVCFSEPLLDFAERVCPPKAPGIAALLTRLRGG